MFDGKRKRKMLRNAHSENHEDGEISMDTDWREKWSCGNTPTLHKDDITFSKSWAVVSWKGNS